MVSKRLALPVAAGLIAAGIGFGAGSPASAHSSGYCGHGNDGIVITTEFWSHYTLYPNYHYHRYGHYDYPYPEGKRFLHEQTKLC